MRMPESGAEGTRTADPHTARPRTARPRTSADVRFAGVPVVRVVRLVREDRPDLHSNALRRPAAHSPLESILIVALADDLQVVPSAVQGGFAEARGRIGPHTPCSALRVGW